ncbi:19377_t:CDS:2, partial [Racocetra persica]
FPQVSWFYYVPNGINQFSLLSSNLSHSKTSNQLVLEVPDELEIDDLEESNLRFFESRAAAFVLYMDVF